MLVYPTGADDAQMDARAGAMEGDAAHQTLQPGATTYQDALEGDTVPQPIDVVHGRRLISVLVRPWLPHSLLAAPYGRVINTFPDHMHEGDVVNDNEVELDKPLDIPGYERPEYPFVELQTNPGTAAEIAVTNPHLRPRPQVVAYAHTTNLPCTGGGRSQWSEGRQRSSGSKHRQNIRSHRRIRRGSRRSWPCRRRLHVAPLVQL